MFTSLLYHAFSLRGYKRLDPPSQSIGSTYSWMRTDNASLSPEGPSSATASPP